MSDIVEVARLTKVYRTDKACPPTRAVDEIEFAVREVFGAKTLATFIRFPMKVLGGVFLAVDSAPDTRAEETDLDWRDLREQGTAA